MEAGTILTRGEWLHKHAIPGTVIADTRGRRAVVVRHRERKQVVAVGGAHVWWETDYLGREWRSVTRSVDGVCDETYEIVGNIYDMEKWKELQEAVKEVHHLSPKGAKDDVTHRPT